MSNALYEHGRSLDLSRFDDNFRAAKTDEDAGVVPDGTYQVVVESVNLGQSQAGNPKITWAMRIIGPQSANRMLFKVCGISENNLHIVKQDLHNCGLDLERLSDLPQMKDRMLDVELEVTKKTRNGDSRVYIDRQLKVQPAADDGLPF